MFVCVDERDLITAYNPNDLSGNTGWVEAPDEIADPIFEEHGVPLYKLEAGHIVARAEAEIAADIAVLAGEEEPSAPKQTIEGRVGKLEGDSAEMREALDMILSGVTE